MNETRIRKPQDFWPVALRGLMGRCPHCGKGALFARYLKQVQECAACHEPLGHIRADDGPAWLTIIVVGHVLAAIMLGVFALSNWPDWVSIVLCQAFALLLALLILPRAKGFFIAIIWRMNCSGAER